MIDNDNIQDELRDLAPSLSKMEKRNPYKVPDAYFEELPAKARERIGFADAERGNNIRRYLLPRYSYISASICFLLIVGGFLVVRNYTSTPKPMAVIHAVPNTDYVMEHVDEDIIMEDLPGKTDFKEVANSGKPKLKKSVVTEDYILENVEESTISDEL